MGADLGVLARRPRPGGDGAAGHKRDRKWQRARTIPRIRLFSHRVSTCARSAVARIRAGRLPTGVYWRVTGASISTSPARVRALPLLAAWDASRLRRSCYREIAATASGSSSACASARRSSRRPRRRSWIWAHRASTSSRHPGAGRNVITWIRPACSVMETPFLTHPGQPPALPRCPHGGRSSPDAPAGGGVRQLDRIRKDVTR
jgi:hypothetical protein